VTELEQSREIEHQYWTGQITGSEALERLRKLDLSSGTHACGLVHAICIKGMIDSGQFNLPEVE
jgi:hypothetical protein